MTNTERLSVIRENERKSHITMYSNSKLYSDGSWLKKPVKTVLDILPHFQSRSSLRVLDLGCGVGRNCIPIAKHFRDIPCAIDCVDILDLAIQKLNEYAEECHVSENITGIVKSIEEFSIPNNHYDFVLAISSLEHIDSKKSFVAKLYEIRNGIRIDGVVCFILNSDVTEFDRDDKKHVPAQFEVNLPTGEVQVLLSEIFQDWIVLKSTVKPQHYEIPRGNRIHDLRTTVVTFAAMKK